MTKLRYFFHFQYTWTNLIWFTLNYKELKQEMNYLGESEIKVEISDLIDLSNKGYYILFGVLYA